MCTRAESLCPEWANEQRMNVLFAPLRDKDLNPESWNSKVRFWINLMEKWSRANSSPVLDIGLLKKEFARNGRTPHCLSEVLVEGVNSGLLSTPENLLQALRSRNQTWGSWVLGLGTSAVKAVGTKVLGSSVNTVIVPSVVEQLKTEILVKLAECDRFVPSNRSSFITEAQLRTHLETVVTQESSRDFILQVLLVERKISKLNLDKLTIYKLAVADEPVDVDEIDKGLLHLKINLDHLSNEIPNLETKVATEEASVRSSLKSGARTKAKVCLKRKKRLDAKLEQLHSQQLNLEHIYEELLTAETNKKIMTAYNSGLDAMKSMVDVSLLNEAESTMSDLAELLDINSQIGETLVMNDPDLDDLERELEELGRDVVDNPSSDKDKETRWKEIDKNGDKDFDSVLQNLEKLEFDLDPVIGSKKAERVEQAL